MSERRPWTATCRLQLHAGFPFAAAQELLPYLRKLGISHVYLSPSLQATPGSMHGYDTTDPGRISEDLGGEEAWRRFYAAAHQEGLGLLLDIVPNHMASVAWNPWWEDLLRHGPFSRTGGSFDTFASDEPDRWRLHIPRLADSLEAAASAGAVRVEVRDGLPRLYVGESSWPLNPASWEAVYPALSAGPSAIRLRELKTVRQPVEAEIEAWHQAAESLRAALAPLAKTVPLAADHAHSLAHDQFYHLLHWREENTAINYRRFFAVGTLAGVRVEDEKVFQATHARVARLAAAGEIDGLRVDHPDGLYDPGEYLARLRSLLPHGRIYVEKIVAAEEELPGAWPVDGSVGYEAMRIIDGVTVHPRGARELTALYADSCGGGAGFLNLALEKKRHVSRSLFGQEFRRLAGAAVRLFGDRHGELTPGQWEEALIEFTACLPVYRTCRDAGPCSKADRRALHHAFVLAKRRIPCISGAALEALAEITGSDSLADDSLHFVRRWQQLSGAVMAKGVEDTAFFCYTPLSGSNEVGGDPAAPAVSLEEFHTFWHRRQQTTPLGMITSSTHDTKRSEDVRARLAVLSEMPLRWSEVLGAWSALNRRGWGSAVPDPAFEWYFYQTLAGAWPLSQDRCLASMEKAVREAGVRTTWTDPDPAYEDAFRSYIAYTYANAAFITSLERFVAELQEAASVNVLSRTLLKLTLPGLPDIYQGNELWDFSLVDPDNRRPVDFTARQAALEEAAVMELPPENWRTPQAKLWLIYRTLQYRGAQPGQFSESAGYTPVYAAGSEASRVIAFARGGETLVTVARFLHRNPEWTDTTLTLPGGVWQDAFTRQQHQGTVPVAVLFNRWPVCLLTRVAAIS